MKNINNAMEIKINILDVKDGDAIIVELMKADKSLVMVIDGGEQEYYETKMKPKLETVLQEHNKTAPDVVVCTHYDSDHIAGLIPLINDYIDDIGQVWVNKTPAMMKGYVEKAIQIQQEKEKPTGTIGVFSTQRLFEGREFQVKERLSAKADITIKSLTQLKNLVDLIPEDKLKQVFHKEHPLDGWEEITVLGPTKEYYKSLFPKTKSFESFIAEEAEEDLPSEEHKMRILEEAETNPCDQLKTDEEIKLSTTNKASIIIAVDRGDKRYLFSGDAGVDSFKAIPDWETELFNLFFLKIPHHASENNLTKELIGIMKPVYAYNTGDTYQDDAVLQCIARKRRNREVKTTKEDGDLFFDNNE